MLLQAGIGLALISAHAAVALSSGGTQPAARRPEAATRLQEYTVDPGHSIVEFSIGFALSRVKGRFTQWRGTILYDSVNPANSSVTAIIETKSIDTGWPNRDRHLRTSDFFDAERYPTITFQSDGLRPAGSTWIADGRLTMHGQTRPVSVPFRFLPGSPARDPVSRNLTLNLEGALRIARADFGILGGATYNSWFTKARSATMADTVEITLEVEGWLADAVSQWAPAMDSIFARVASSGVGSQMERLRQLRSTRPVAEWPNYFRGQDFLVRRLLFTGRKADGLTLARALPDLFPDSTDALMVLGFALSANGDASAARAAYARAKKVYVAPQRDPNDPFPQDDASWYYLDQLARTALEQGLVAEGVELARAVAELYPETARAHSRYGHALALANRLTDANAAFAKALAIDPNDTRALEYRRRLVR